MAATAEHVASEATHATAHTLETTLDVVKGESFKTHWQPPPTLTWPVPEGDYRDQLPPLIHQVAEQYAPVVRSGRWTHGLFECWAPKMRVLKASVHIPCWEAYNINSFRTWKEVIGSLSTLYCWASLALGCGLGHLWSAGGSYGLNMMSWFSCVSRQHLRRRFRLPSTFGLPESCDDCAVHTCCMYCASHQELRELAVRGVGGPGIHVLDVTPRSFSHVPGIEVRLQERAAELAAMEEAPVAFPPPTAIPEEVEMHRVP
ncbi:hypothetical protein WJX75_003029 [Coccomyxa subellipsoidea]|uniref:PLAC8-domain-containing protein n=1 Tax=Coccomyxa subellipsoidea TaxID=248742 RepID=A0ABR2YG57_9CHLO